MKILVLIWLKVTAIGLSAFLCICLVQAFQNLGNDDWFWMVCFSMLLIFILLEKFKEVTGYGSILSAITVGANLLIVIVNVATWPEARMAIISLITSFLAILLAGACHSKKNQVVFLHRKGNSKRQR